MRSVSPGVIVRLLVRLIQPFCRVMYQVTPPAPPPLPESGPVLLVSDHTSLGDPLVLLATAGRPIIFLTAIEIYQRLHMRWLCQALGYIPVSRGANDAGAVRAMLRNLGEGKVVSIFPEGGIDEYRKENGHLGVGYLALKTGAPVVPASISWGDVRPLNLLGTLLTPGKAVVQYGTPIVLQRDRDPGRERIHAVTARIMQAIRELRTVTG